MLKFNFLPGLLLTAFMAFIVTTVTGTNYYVDATNGNDSNNGTSPATAWQTLSKVSGFSVSAGDSILFKRGEMWRGDLDINNSGTNSSPIVYGAYGSGDKPLFCQSVNLNSTDDWTSLGSNRWACSNGSFASDVGFMLFGEERADNVGLKCTSQGEVDADKEFWYDGSNDRVVVYSTRNPASEYSSIEISKTTDVYDHFIGIWGISYLHIENLEIKYWNSHAMAFTNTTGIEVKNCDISYGGGASRGSDRYGNGIEFWLSATNCVVEGCRVGQCYDTGITPQAGGNQCTVNNVVFRNNILWGNDLAGFELGYYNNSASLSDIHVENNVFIGNGHGWSHRQRPDTHVGWDVSTWSGYTGTFNGFYLKDNVYYEAGFFSLYYRWKKTITNLEMDYNYYYKSSGDLIDDHQARYTMAQFSDYQNDKGRDTHSSYGNRSDAQNTARAKVSGEDIFFLNTLFQEVDELVFGNLPTSFDLLSPMDKSSIDDNAATLTWGASVGTGSELDHYEVWIDYSHVGDVPAGTTTYTTQEMSRGSHNWFVIAVCADGNWCQSINNFTFIMGEPTNASGLINDNILNDFFVYPNPTEDEINVKISDFNPAIPIQLTVINSSGVEIIRDRISSGKMSYKLGKSGLYFVAIMKGNRKGETIKIIKQE